MKAVIQRVLNADVKVDNNIVGEIDKGFVILLGVEKEDTHEDADILALKTSKLRVFCDEDDKMNLSLLDTKYDVLVISQFTLCANCKKGNRPSFTNSAKPEYANELYEYFMAKLKETGIKKIQHGIFGADMKVSLVNDGPVTILYDTKEWI